MLKLRLEPGKMVWINPVREYAIFLQRRRGIETWQMKICTKQVCVHHGVRSAGFCVHFPTKIILAGKFIELSWGWLVQKLQETWSWSGRDHSGKGSKLPLSVANLYFSDFENFKFLGGHSFA
tara:strand:- start:2552 stop:2917 length:366 start_codon:yes stop_codon:yes gene_type:complete